MKFQTLAWAHDFAEQLAFAIRRGEIGCRYYGFDPARTLWRCEFAGKDASRPLYAILVELRP